MRKILFLACLLPTIAYAGAPQLNILLAPQGAEASDAELRLASGFIQCDPAVALSRQDLAPLGVKFAAPGFNAAPPSIKTAAAMILAPRPGPQTEAAADGRGYLSVGADYRLSAPLRLLTSTMQISQVGQSVYFLEQPPVQSIALRFKQPAAEAVRAFDARFGGSLSARLGEQHSSVNLWYVIEDGGHTLRCYRRPDQREKP